MGIFERFVTIKENGRISASLGENPNGQDDALGRIIRLAWDRYEPEAKEFFKELANKDPDIKEEFDKLDRTPHSSFGYSATKEKDIIVPHIADSGEGAGGSGDD